MSLRIVCSGHLIRHPVGGHTWHHLQYLIGFKRLGHQVTFFEDFGWPDSCYDVGRNVMCSDPTYGINYHRPLFQAHGLDNDWCYLAQDGVAHGLSRAELTERLAACDVYFNLSNVNWIPEVEHAKKPVIVDTDPVFTQIGGHGMKVPFSNYHARFTYGENVHQPGCEMPTAGQTWLPTRQPVVLDLWPSSAGDPQAPITTVINWSAYGDREYQGRVYGQKDREFEPFFELPSATGEVMEIAVNGPKEIKQRLTDGGWHLREPREVTRDPFTYQQFIANSRAEFCVAKHGYVSTQCGWFSDRTSAYLAMGRPAAVQNTGFDRFLPTGKGLLSFRTPEDAIAQIGALASNYEGHCMAARQIAEEHFDATRVLSRMLEAVV